MSVKKEKPATGAVRGGHYIERLGGAFDNENTKNQDFLQAYRRNYLSRRHRLAPSIAAAVAGLAFTVEATK